MRTAGQIIVTIATIIGVSYFLKKLIDESIRNKENAEKALGGDASESDQVGQQYKLLTPYAAVNEKTKAFKEFAADDKFVKKTAQNSASINEQDSVLVFDAKGQQEYIMPKSILKKV